MSLIIPAKLLQSRLLESQQDIPMTESEQNSSGADQGNTNDYSESDSRVDAIAALAIILILASAALYFVAGG